MPFAFLIIGIVLIVAAVRNTVTDNNGQPGLFTLVKNDFVGPNNYLYWVVSILIIGAVGYIPTLKPLSRIFLALVIIVLFLSHGGVFQQFNAQLFGASSSSGGSTSLADDISSWIDHPTGMQGIETPLAPARPTT